MKNKKFIIICASVIFVMVAAVVAAVVIVITKPFGTSEKYQTIVVTSKEKNASKTEDTEDDNNSSKTEVSSVSANSSKTTNASSKNNTTSSKNNSSGSNTSSEQSTELSSATIASNMNRIYAKMNSSAGIKATDKEISASVYNVGNRYRIANVINKAKSGKRIKVAFLGGSITVGAGSNATPESGVIKASPSGNAYDDWVCDWLAESFECLVTNINAGIGATDSVYGTHRLYEDVLSSNPDLVILEYDCNDSDVDKNKQGTYESIVRKCIDNGTALIIFSFCKDDGGSSQAMHEPIATHYNIPMISYRDAFLDNAKFTYFTNDGIHPNATGHTLAGRLICKYIESVYKNLDSVEKEDITLPSTTVNADAKIYDGAYEATLKDIYDNKVEGVRIKDLGSFSFDKTETKFVYKNFVGLTAGYSENYKPLVIEVDKCKTAFLQMFRSSKLLGSEFSVKLNGSELNSNTFTCMHGSDNSQTELTYMWATERLCYFDNGKSVTIEITPKITSENSTSYVKLFALLLS